MIIKQKYCQLAALAGLLVTLAGGAGAAEPAASDWARTDQSQVRLVAASTTTGGAETMRLGLQFRLNPGWKTYWRSPGDAGLPPRLDWTGSQNLAGAEIAWPAPERVMLLGFETFGYSDEFVLPITARLARPGEAMSLAVKLDYMVCEKICIPYETNLTLALQAGAAQPSPYTHLIDQYVARVPGEGARSGLSIERAEWNGGGAPAITVIASAAQPFVKPELLVEGPRADPWRGAGFGKPESFYTEGGTRALLRVPLRPDPLNPDAPPSPEAVSGVGYVGAPITLTLIDGARTMEFRTVLAAGPPSAVQGRENLGAILLVALLGGLVLNLMPCVLPVLSLKLLTLAGHAGAAHGRIRRNFVASAAGVICAFLMLAAGLIALKSAGATIGWGVQFQQPVFIIAMMLLLTAFAANLWGWFDFRLPGAVADSTAAIGQGEGAGASFLTGAFAAVLATPCSAPFVGTAVGFALANGPLEILAIFAALGLGLAAPYLAVAAFPALAARLPRPGRWMIRLRIILGAALIATAAWLLSVLLAQTGQATALAAAGAAAALLAILALVHRAQFRAVALGVAVAGAAFAMPFYFSATASPATREAGEKIQWRKFDLAAIESEVRAGRLVFVDVTADWCLTCQVNKAAVLSRGEIATRLAAPDVTPMRADWTRPDDGIGCYLASFGRYGIPFNVVYGPGAPGGAPLPELLTGEAVLEALGRAAGRVAAAPAS